MACLGRPTVGEVPDYFGVICTCCNAFLYNTSLHEYLEDPRVFDELVCSSCISQKHSAGNKRKRYVYYNIPDLVRDGHISREQELHARQRWKKATAAEVSFLLDLYRGNSGFQDSIPRTVAWIEQCVEPNPFGGEHDADWVRRAGQLIIKYSRVGYIPKISDSDEDGKQGNHGNQTL